MKSFLSFVFVLCLIHNVFAQDYNNYQQISQRVRALKDKYPDKVQFKSLGKTAGGKDVWVITLGKGETDKHPAIAIAGGVDGRHLLGVEMAIGVAERILVRPDIDTKLTGNTYYIFPNVQPDATEQYFAALRYERTVNARNTDNDRDGSFGEDAYEDLNNDRMITEMRVESPKGTHIESPKDPRVLVKADPAKGETGKYLVLSEGTDNDRDGLFNEDGEGGVNFNRNFTFGYKNFQSESGEYAVSEIESRAVADFLYDAFNVHTVLSFSLNNNLSEPAKAYMTSNTGINRNQENTNDSKIYSYVNSLYTQSVTDMAQNTVIPPDEGGEFYTWAYQHYGRYSFATPAWRPSLPDEKDKEITGNPDLLYLKWAEQKGIGDVFVPWTTVKHPDFPDYKVEVGGIKPFMKYNPPYEMVSKLIDEHVKFIGDLTLISPRIAITELKKEILEKDLFRVTLTVKNEGLMPTIHQIGERSNYLKYVTIQVKPASRQSLLQGNLKETKPVLTGGESAEFTWLVRGSGKLSIEAGCPTAGFASAEIVL
ncbi:MAG: hypothetical protein LBE79_11740 [Tannerella sp.]|jgi:hypothetical protein|nr:hypothetical protein [Tannerella sp.]